ncbi:hypothetical protein BMJ32_11690 [Sinorhizobium medicae]|nr:hypothetical protein BMJ35_30660 [Sinorhizobium medicae]PLU02821.1 hypothetical protein BMJ32_11690 [Sinorhizobium medicae]PLU05376.1 hypothetical protein BMJ34_07450 [Sinorhizobium medicae]PLU05670.1 hypothetical protein BMJ33_08485 [Sinorhizobium medicae]PLU13657.1 hypothetical protein BMJ30_24970 [Sinorhizobium medicae]
MDFKRPFKAVGHIQIHKTSGAKQAADQSESDTAEDGAISREARQEARRNRGQEYQLKPDSPSWAGRFGGPTKKRQGQANGTL